MTRASVTMTTPARVAAAVALLTAVMLVAWPAPAAAQKPGLFSYVEVERLETRLGGGDETLHWNVQGWLGGDFNRLWLKTEGDHVIDGSLDNAELQVLYSRLIAPFWNLQAGARYDVRPEPTRGFAVFGIQGLAPYFFEVDAAAFLSHEGDVSARVEAEHALLLTQRLILEPSAELNLAVQEVKELGIGSGLTDVELGLRLRYEIVREFAPYVGVSWERKVGETADFARQRGEDVDNVKFVVGVRFWF